MEHGFENRFAVIRISKWTDYGVLHVWSVVPFHIGDSCNDGRIVSVLTYVASALGRVHEQVL